MAEPKLARVQYETYYPLGGTRRNPSRVDGNGRETLVQSRLGYGPFLGFDDTVFHGVAGQSGRGADVQLAHNSGFVIFHGLNGNVESGRDFLVLASLGHQLENLLLADAEALSGSLAFRGF